MKFHITDEDGKTCVVEELEEEKETKDEEPSEEIVLSKEDILALKSLIPHIEKIKSLVIEKEEEKEEVSDEDEEEIVGKEVEEEIQENDEDEEEEIDEDENEEIIDTDKDREDTIHDSVGAINKKNAKTNDAFDAQIDIDAAWAKRYNGGNE